MQSFFTHVRLNSETGCWNWLGTKTRAGYGVLMHLGKKQYAHRLSAAFYLGFDLTSPMCVLHRCDNPACFNPKHLFIGDRGDNIRDCVAKGRYRNQNTALTHCPQGHPYSGDNLYVTKEGFRHCKTCSRNRTQEWRKNRTTRLS